MAKVTESVLNELMSVTVAKLMERLEDPECPASFFSTAVQLLRDNNIECDPDEINKPGALRDNLLKLPFPVEGEDTNECMG